MSVSGPECEQTGKKIFVERDIRVSKIWKFGEEG